jgi:large subunit ribosomal protein L33
MAGAKVKKKKDVINVRLVSTAKKADGSATGYFYIRTRNPKKLTNKLQFRLYDPIVRQHVSFVEEKERHQS